MSENFKISKNKQIFITPPIVNGDQWLQASRIKYNLSDKELSKPNRNLENTKLYSQKCVEIGEKIGVGVLDLFSLMEAEPVEVRNGLLSDGLHLSQAGNVFLFEKLKEKFLVELTKDVEQFLPNWRDLP